MATTNLYSSILPKEELCFEVSAPAWVFVIDIVGTLNGLERLLLLDVLFIFKRVFSESGVLVWMSVDRVATGWTFNGESLNCPVSHKTMGHINNATNDQKATLKAPKYIQRDVMKRSISRPNTYHCHKSDIIRLVCIPNRKNFCSSLLSTKIIPT